MEIKHHPGTPCNLELASCDIKIPKINDAWALPFLEEGCVIVINYHLLR